MGESGTGDRGGGGDAGFHRRRQVAAEERHLGRLSAPAAEREDPVGVGVGAHFQTIEILGLTAEAGVVYLDVVIAFARKREVGYAGRGLALSSPIASCLPSPSRMRNTGSIADPQRRASTSNMRRLAALSVDPENVALGAAQSAVHRDGRAANRLGGLDGVVAIGLGVGLRFLLGHLGERAHREEQHVRDSAGALEADGIDAGRGLRQAPPGTTRRVPAPCIAVSAGVRV